MVQILRNRQLQLLVPWNGCSSDSAIMLWKSLDCSVNRPREEELTVSTDFPGMCGSPLESGSSSSQLTCPSWYHEEQRQMAPNDSCPNCRFMCKTSDYYCFKPLNFGRYFYIVKVHQNTYLIIAIRFVESARSSGRPKDSVLTLIPFLIFLARSPCPSPSPTTIDSSLGPNMALINFWIFKFLYCSVADPHFTMAVLKSHIRKYFYYMYTLYKYKNFF